MAKLPSYLAIVLILNLFLGQRPKESKFDPDFHQLVTKYVNDFTVHKEVFFYTRHVSNPLTNIRDCTLGLYQRSFLYVCLIDAEDNIATIMTYLEVQGDEMKIKRFAYPSLASKQYRGLQKIFKGVNEFDRFILLRGFDLISNKLELILINYESPSTRHYFTNFHQIVSRFIELSHVGDLDLETIYEKLQISIGFSSRKNQRQLWGFIWLHSYHMILYIEIDLLEKEIVKFTTFDVRLNNNFVNIKNIKIACRRYLFINTNEGVILAPLKIFGKTNTASLKHFEIKFPRNFQRFSCISKNLFLLADKTSIFFYEIEFDGTSLTSFVETYRWENSFCHSLNTLFFTSSHFGCLFTLKEKTYLMKINFSKMRFGHFYIVREPLASKLRSGYKLITFKHNQDGTLLVVFIDHQPVVFSFHREDFSFMDSIDQSSAPELENSSDSESISTIEKKFHSQKFINQKIFLDSYINVGLFSAELHNSADGFKLRKYEKDTVDLDINVDLPNLVIGISYSAKDLRFISLIVVSQNMNIYLTNFDQKSSTNSTFNSLNGILSSKNIEDIFFIKEKIFVRFENQIGFYDFKKSTVFTEITIKVQKYLFVCPLPIEDKDFFLGLNDRKVDLFAQKKVYYSADFVLGEDIRVISYTYDEHNPYSLFLLLSNYELRMFQVTINSFISLNIEKHTFKRNDGKILAIKNFQNKFVMMSLSKTKVLTVKLYMVIEMKLVEIANDSMSNVSECIDPFYRILKKIQNTSTGNSISAIFTFCLRTDNDRSSVFSINLDKTARFKIFNVSKNIIRSVDTPFNMQMGVIRDIGSDRTVDKLVILRTKDMNNSKTTLDLFEIFSRPYIEMSFLDSSYLDEDYEVFVIYQTSDKGSKKVCKILITPGCSSLESPEMLTPFINIANQVYQTQRDGFAFMRVHISHIYKQDKKDLTITLSDPFEEKHAIAEKKGLVHLVKSFDFSAYQLGSLIEAFNVKTAKDSLKLFMIFGSNVVAYDPIALRFQGQPSMQKFHKRVMFISKGYLLTHTNSTLSLYDSSKNELIFSASDPEIQDVRVFESGFTLTVPYESQPKKYHLYLYYIHDSVVMLMNRHNLNLRTKGHKPIDLGSMILIPELLNDLSLLFFVFRKDEIDRPARKIKFPASDFIINYSLLMAYLEQKSRASMRCQSPYKIDAFECTIVFQTLDAIQLYFSFSKGEPELLTAKLMDTVLYREPSITFKFGSKTSLNFHVVYFEYENEIKFYFFKRLALIEFVTDNIVKVNERLSVNKMLSTCFLSINEIYLENVGKLLIKKNSKDEVLRKLSIGDYFFLIVTSERLLHYQINLFAEVKFLKKNIASESISFTTENYESSDSFQVNISKKFVSNSNLRIFKIVVVFGVPLLVLVFMALLMGRNPV